MRLTRFAFAALALAASSSAQAGALLDAYKKAQLNDKTLQAAGYQRDGALQARPLALAAFLPQVAGEGRFTLQDSTDSYSASRFGQASSATITQKTTTDERRLSLNLSQALFNWEAFKRLNKSGNQIALAQTSLVAAQQQLVLRVAQAYFNVLAAQDYLSFAEAENKAVSRQLDQSSQRFEVGLSAITDVQESQSRYDLTVAQKIDAETQLANAHRALAEITGSNDDATTSVADDFPLAGPDPLLPSAWIDAAKTSNLNVLAARLTLALAEDDIKIARAGHIPSLSLEGGYADASGNFKSSINGQSGSKSPTSSDGYQIAAVARIPIFAGGAIRAGERAAVATYEQRRVEWEGAGRTAERQTGDAYQGVVSGIARVKALKQAVKSTQTALEASEVGLQVGARTAIDVLNAQREVSNAKRNYAQARYNYLLSVLSLKLSAGRLGEADLAEIDRLLAST